MLTILNRFVATIFCVYTFNINFFVQRFRKTFQTLLEELVNRHSVLSCNNIDFSNFFPATRSQ